MIIIASRWVVMVHRSIDRNAFVSSLMNDENMPIFIRNRQCGRRVNDLGKKASMSR